MAAEVLNMSDLTINKYWCKLKDLYLKTATKPYTQRYVQFKDLRYNNEIYFQD